MTKTDYFQRVRIAAGSCSEMPTNTASLPMGPPPTGSTEHAAAFHIPHTTTVATTLEPDLDYLGHRYVLRALILAQPGHFVTISRRWCGRPRSLVWLYQDSMHDPEPVLTAIARRQGQRGATRTETDLTMEDFYTLYRLVEGTFRGLLCTLEDRCRPRPNPTRSKIRPPPNTSPNLRHPTTGTRRQPPPPRAGRARDRRPYPYHQPQERTIANGYERGAWDKTRENHPGGLKS